eukprot:scaffold137283_cov27-Tisochrysis_lutea.AAC.2
MALKKVSRPLALLVMRAAIGLEMVFRSPPSRHSHSTPAARIAASASSRVFTLKVAFHDLPRGEVKSVPAQCAARRSNLRRIPQVEVHGQVLKSQQRRPSLQNHGAARRHYAPRGRVMWRGSGEPTRSALEVTPRLPSFLARWPAESAYHPTRAALRR